MFSIAEAAAVLDCNPGVIRSQVDRREGLLFGSVRRDQLSVDDVLAMGLLRQVQAALGEKSPAAKRVVRDYMPFARGVLDDEGRRCRPASLFRLEKA